MGRKLEVGQTVYKRDYRGRSGELKEKTISRVGRMYFYLQNEHSSYKYSVDTLRQVSDFNGSAQIYLSKEDYESEQRMSKIREEVRGQFGSYVFPGKKTLTDSQYQRIHQIINE